MPKRENAERLRRRTGFREPNPRMLIVCEGSVTEKRYFEFIRHRERIPLQLEVIPAGVPLTVVQRAKAESQKDAFDAVWCVFDVDEHPKIAQAKELARREGFRVAISNPCFELWLLLHFQDQSAHIHRHQVQSLCRKHMPGYHKAPDCEGLMSSFDTALKRAVSLIARHFRNGTIGGNPSTDVHELVLHMRRFRTS